jgi:putative Mn2+ efflux pump MntP
MIRSGVNQTEDVQQNDPTRGLSLILLSIATSIDALSVGFGLSMLGMKIWTPSIVIGLITMLVSAIGVTTGSRLGLKFGKRMQIVGGVVLIMIGIRIVVSHMIG